ncbi:glycosyltransferase family 9 protein [Bdellovibrio sp. HCB290]|uniref:glycosyltransferase family 9 protein n=1 Tax=Bdellovibrio sp. HCB290 TaxID=3394356 RepID=UPI0039B6BDA8
MKILVVSLLRLGDIIQQQPLLKALRNKYPQAEIHLLINRQFSQVESLLHGLVDKYFYFDRDALQKGLGEASYNILWSHRQLEMLVKELNGENYQQIVNFTHNKLSAYLIGSLQAPVKQGLHHAEGVFQGLKNPWLRYFNERFSGTQPSLFHYVELLGKSFGLPVSRLVLPQTNKSKRILFQCLTSDSKKNWALGRFKQLKDTIESSLVDYKVQILCAPFEKNLLTEVFSEADLLVCDLAEGQKALGESCLLVTGDTSIKHLAAQMGVPTVELVLGSSDWTKTAAFSGNSEVIVAQTACSPCTHSQACSQKSQICAEQISVDQVFAAVWDKLSKKQVKPVVTLRDLERISWSLKLDGVSASEVIPYANAALEFSKSGDTDSVRCLLKQARQSQDQYEVWISRLEAAFPKREDLIGKSQLKSHDIGEFILTAQEVVKSKQDTAGYFQSVVETLMARFSSTLQFHEKMQSALAEVRELLQSRGQFIHSLEIVLKEGAYYAAGIGQLSIDSFEEAGRSVSRDREDAAL